MTWIKQRITPRYYTALAVLSVAVLMTLVYDHGWKFGLPLGLRNLAGVVLFSCIMLGCGLAYLGARMGGATTLTAAQIGLLVPLVWHMKEMWVAGSIYGVGAGLYAGLQGPYLFYYCLMGVVMGLSHLFYELVQMLKGREAKPISAWVFFLPLLLIGGLEGLVQALWGYDIFVFQGFLAGYSALFA